MYVCMYMYVYIYIYIYIYIYNIKQKVRGAETMPASGRGRNSRSAHAVLCL